MENVSAENGASAPWILPESRAPLYSNEQDANNILNSVTKSTTVRRDYRAAGMLTSKGSVIHFTFMQMELPISLSLSLLPLSTRRQYEFSIAKQPRAFGFV